MGPAKCFLGSVTLLVVLTVTQTQAEKVYRDPCQNFGCQNGGRCTVPSDSDRPYCVCALGYTGPKCQNKIVTRDPCQHFVCENGGRCTAPADRPYCICPHGYTGPKCQNRIVTRDPCQNFECQNGGRCTAPADRPYCICPLGYIGPKCQNRIVTRDPCKNFVCQNGGRCTARADRPYCICPHGYTGPKCQNRIVTRDPCKNFVCQNGGRCTAPADRPYCICPHGYTGPKCQNRIVSRDPCQNFVCENGGRCTAPADRPYCICPLGYIGTKCQNRIVPRDPCRNFRCQNGGTCTALAYRPVCRCPHGYNGRRCQNRIVPQDPCRNFRCQNGGTCTAPAHRPFCRCPPGYNGQRCQNRIVPRDPCRNFKCQNGGTCTAPADRPFCRCPSGYNGRRCQNKIIIFDPCRGFECLNGGSCSAPADAPLCRCPAGFTGDRCERKTDDRPGTCPNVEGQIGVCGGIFCKADNDCPQRQKCCPSACGGKLCTTPLTVTRDPCRNFVCHNGGRCTAPADFAFCKCPPGYTGRQCENKINDPCKNFRCQNNGRCAPRNGMPFCECDNGFTGEFCETAIEKPGMCPASRDVGVCGGRQCKQDSDCRGDEKCCDSPCGSKLCQDPDTTPTVPSITCANVLCKPENATCRMVIPCKTCEPRPKCFLIGKLGEGIDIECQRQNYRRVLLVGSQTTPVSYSQVKCRGPLKIRDCPKGFDCVDDLRGGGTCCEDKSEKPLEKPGSCPKGKLSVCGGVFCKNDFNCPGKQKCCPGCGNLCTDPEEPPVTCGNSVCAPGEVCVQKRPPCPPGRFCIQAFIPTCVPAGCANCKPDEECKPLAGTAHARKHHCVAKSQCGIDRPCPPGQRCVQVKPYVFECQPDDRCGGCSKGEVCIDTGIRCVKAPCPTYQCVKNNLCGGCPPGQKCEFGFVPCPTQPECDLQDPNAACVIADCAAPTCVDESSSVPSDECGLCPKGQVCVDTGIRCVTEPCDSHVCVPDDKCGGCPPGRKCELLPTPCPPPCDYVRAQGLDTECTDQECLPQPVCVKDPSFKPPPAPPVCSLRCPPDHRCTFAKPPCMGENCNTTPVPTCVPVIRPVRSCPRPSKQYDPTSTLCLREQRSTTICHKDSDCSDPDRRCCLSKCGRKICLIVGKNWQG